MPYTGGINLHKFQSQMGTFSEEFIQKQAVKLISVIECLHEKGFIHQDIKPSNVLFNPENGELSLIDFGMARPCNKDAPEERRIKCSGGTPEFAPPEYEHCQRVWGPEIDVYCFAALIFYMFF